MTHGSLFSGIGGFDLAASWVGWTNVFQCEKDEWCRKVLTKNFPDVIRCGDIKNLSVDNYGNLIYIDDENVTTMGQPLSTKYTNAVSLYEHGMSIQECADFYEISRQAMNKILERRGCVFRDNKRYGSENNFYRGCLPDNTKKKRVQHLVEKAIKNGILISPKRCSNCGSSFYFKDGRSGIQAHHCDYDKPLDVIWLCQKCHHDWHVNNKAINETDIEKTNEPSGVLDVISGGFP